MMPKPASLGDEAEQKYRLIQEAFPMPPGRKQLISGIEQILSGGGVQKLVVQVGQDIKVTRAVKDDGNLDAPVELLEDDLMDAVRNSEMVEFLMEEGDSPYEYLFKAFREVSNRQVDKARLQPKVFIVKKMNQLTRFLDVPNLSDLFSVEVTEHKEIPEDTMLFVTANASDIEEVKLSLRMELNTPWRAK
jgi:hypothetical protein